MSRVVTRFAPSPTGLLHLGGARTALFNWLYAKHFGGVMCLRIEDTDAQRSTEFYKAAILEGLRWLQLDWESEPVLQSTRRARHREVVQQLLQSGHAYYDAQPPKSPTSGGESSVQDRSTSVGAVRLRVQKFGKTTLEDCILGQVTWDNQELDDLVLLRSDGTPTYMLAVVVDDHDMQVTHVLRGVDHLTNAARQLQIYHALQWTPPTMGHFPLIHSESGAKLSKREGAVGIDVYRDQGFLPEALRNYLLRLGWSHGDQEFFTTEEMTVLFDIKSIGKSSSRLDSQKLLALNHQWLNTLSQDECWARCLSFLNSHGAVSGFKSPVSGTLKEQFIKIFPLLRQRAKTLEEVFQDAVFLLPPEPLTTEHYVQWYSGTAKHTVEQCAIALANCSQWDRTSLDTVLKAFMVQHNLKMKTLAPLLRVALTSQVNTFPLFSMMEVLGKKECLARITRVNTR